MTHTSPAAADDARHTSSTSPRGGSTPPQEEAWPSERALRFLGEAERQIRQLSSVLDPLGEVFAAAGHDLFLVGGSVRDALLGQVGTDLDFTTDARPETVVAILSSLTDSVWDTGIEFGTVSAVVGGWQIEITTFRTDVYDGVTRNPEVEFGETLGEDLIRRDFTVNAIAVQVKAGGKEMCDPLEGMRDLVDGVLDTPREPELSFRDDPLRMLRACRFVSTLGFTPSVRVVQAMGDMAEEITRITPERVRVELDKLMLGDYPDDGIALLCSSGLADYVFPEIPGMVLPPDPALPHKDVYEHSVQVLRQAMALEDGDPDLVLRWAALLHDVGKPATRAPKPGGGVTFHQHEVVGARMVRKRMRALKYSKQMINDVSQLVFLHLRIHGYGDAEWTDSAVRRYVTDAGPLLERLNMLVRADCTTAKEWKRQRQQHLVDSLDERIAELREKENLQAIRPDLDGHEIMELLGVPAGPVVGQAWTFLKELRMERGPLGPEEARGALLAWRAQQQAGVD